MLKFTDDAGPFAGIALGLGVVWLAHFENYNLGILGANVTSPVEPSAAVATVYMDKVVVVMGMLLSLLWVAL